MGNNVLLVVASTGFQPQEYQEPKQILEDAGFVVDTASDKPGVAVAKDGFETEVDHQLDTVVVSDYVGVFIIGGPGALEHLDNQHMYRILQEAQAAGKPYGAICISTRILAQAGVLTGKVATGWDGDGRLRSILEAHGARFTSEDVAVDGNVVTASGPTVAVAFSKAIVQLLV